MHPLLQGTKFNLLLSSLKARTRHLDPHRRLTPGPRVMVT